MKLQHVYDTILYDAINEMYTNYVLILILGLNTGDTHKWDIQCIVNCDL